MLVNGKAFEGTFEYEVTDETLRLLLAIPIYRASLSLGLSTIFRLLEWCINFYWPCTAMDCVVL